MFFKIVEMWKNNYFKNGRGIYKSLYLRFSLQPDSVSHIWNIKQNETLP